MTENRLWDMQEDFGYVNECDVKIVQMLCNQDNVRCRIANYFAEQYGVLGYLEADNFVNPEYHQSFIDDIEEEIRRNSKAPFVKNFRDNYEGGQLPIYALVEVFSFGTLSKFYKNMKNPDKKAVAKSFGVGYTYFESWLESISYVRNIFAHNGRLYNAKLSKTPMLYKEYSEAGIGNNRIFLLKKTSNSKMSGWFLSVKIFDD